MMVESVAGSHDSVGESPVWHPEERCVYWVDINGARIRRFCLSTSALQTWQFNQPVTALSLCENAEHLVVAIGGHLILWNPRNDHRQDFAQVDTQWPRNRLNDGGSGPDGNFWVGSMQNNVASDGGELPIEANTGSLYRVTPNGEVTVHDSGFGITNTITWSPDKSVFYCGCSRSGVLYSYRFDRTKSEISQRRIFANSGYPGVPDGSAVDCNGVLWNCRHSGKCILGFSPKGELVRKIEMPTTHITRCAFGGDDLRTLYVTTASLGAPNNEPLAGNLLSLRMETPGLPPYRFAI